MTTLTATVSIYKKLIYLLIAAIVAVIAILILLRLGGVVKNLIAPTPPTPPTIAFGALPKLDYSEGYKPLADTRFLIETISGDLPSLGDRAKVLVIAEPISKFGAIERAITSAKQAGFSEVPIETSDKGAKFVDPEDASRILTIGTIDESISLESGYLRSPVIILSRPQSDERPRDMVVNLFEKLSVPLKAYPQDKTLVENFKIENGILERSLSLSTANLIRVVFNRVDINKIPIINPDSENPLVWGLANDNKVVAAQFLSNDIQAHRFATYPLRSAQAALDDLKKGNGALNKEPKSNTFPVRNVKLAYLETEKIQPYLQPVYVFESDDGLFAYSSAVADAFISSESSRSF